MNKTDNDYKVTFNLEIPVYLTQDDVDAVEENENQSAEEVAAREILFDAPAFDWLSVEQQDELTLQSVETVNNPDGPQ